MKRVITAFLAVFLFFSIPSIYAAASIWVQPVAKVMASVDQIKIFQDSKLAGYCSAFSINDTKDYFLSAAHCLGEQMTVGGVQAFAIFVDIDSDLMVLVAPDSGSYPSVTPASEDVKMGQDVGALGFGYGLPQLTFMAGTVTQPALKDLEFPTEVYLVFGGQFIRGMSGGPVFNDKGEVVSVVQMGNETIGLGRVLNEVLAKTGKYWEVKAKT